MPDPMPREETRARLQAASAEALWALAFNGPPRHLTSTQRELIRLVSRGYTAPEISAITRRSRQSVWHSCRLLGIVPRDGRHGR